MCCIDRYVGFVVAPSLNGSVGYVWFVMSKQCWVVYCFRVACDQSKSFGFRTELTIVN